MTVIPIDLRSYREPLQHFMKLTVETFAQSREKREELSCAALYVFPYDPVATICFDTRSSSDSFVAEWSKKGEEDYYGKDDYGLFKNNPPDFEFVNVSVLTLEGFPNLCDAPDRLTFVDFRGESVNVNRIEDGDEGINRAMSPSFCTFVREFSGWATLPRATIFRAGVVFRDSDCMTFWRVE